MATYEAQPAIELEALLDPDDDSPAYPFGLDADAADGVTRIRTGPLFEALLTDLRAEVPAGRISRRFHDGLIAVLAEVAVRAREQTGLERVCLSGGTFHNVRMLRGLRSSLEARGFDVFAPERVPAGDGGLSLGQAAVAAHVVG